MTDTIASDWSRELTTRIGFHFKVRPAQPTDEAVLTGLKTVGHECLAAMTAIDHHQTEHFLAFVDGAYGHSRLREWVLGGGYPRTIASSKLLHDVVPCGGPQTSRSHRNG